MPPQAAAATSPPPTLPADFAGFDDAAPPSKAAAKPKLKPPPTLPANFTGFDDAHPTEAALASEMQPKAMRQAQAVTSKLPEPPSPAKPTERAMQQGIGAPPMFVDVPIGQGKQFEAAGRAGYAEGGKQGMEMVGGAALGGLAEGLPLLAKVAAVSAGAGAGNVTGRLASGKLPDMKDFMDTLATYGISEFAGGLLEGTGKALGKSKFVGSIINRSAGAQVRDVRYGNPARAIVDENILSPTTEGRLAATKAKISEVAPQLNQVLATAQAPIPLATVIDRPISDAIDKVGKSAMTAAEKRTAVEQLEALRDTLYNTHSLAGGRMVSTPRFHTPSVSAADANALKQLVGDEVNWTKRPVPFSQLVEDGYRDVYGSLKTAVNGSVGPQAAQVNERLSNLISLRNSLEELSLREKAGRGEMTGLATIGKMEAMSGRAAPAAVKAVGAAGSGARWAPRVKRAATPDAAPAAGQVGQAFKQLGLTDLVTPRQQTTLETLLRGPRYKSLDEVDKAAAIRAVLTAGQQ